MQVRREALAVFGKQAKCFSTGGMNFVFVRSQQPGEDARTQKLDNWEALENPLCPAKVHHVGKPFAAKLLEKDDSFLPSIRPGGKFNAGGGRKERMCQLICKPLVALYSLTKTSLKASLRGRVQWELLVSHPFPKEHAAACECRGVLNLMGEQPKPSVRRKGNWSPFENTDLKRKTVSSDFQWKTKIKCLLYSWYHRYNFFIG